MSLFDLRYTAELVRAGFTKEEIIEMAKLPKTEPEDTKEQNSTPALEEAKQPAVIPPLENPAPADKAPEEQPKPATDPHKRTEAKTEDARTSWLKDLAENS